VEWRTGGDGARGLVNEESFSIPLLNNFHKSEDNFERKASKLKPHIL